MPLASTKPLYYGTGGQNFYAAKINKESNDVTWRGNVQDLTAGSSFNIVYRTGSGDTPHKILSDVALSYYFTNVSAVADEDFYPVTIWQCIDDLVIYINGVKCFESSSKALNLYHRWLQAIMERSDNKAEMESYIAEECGKHLTSYDADYHDVTSVGDGESSGYYHTSLATMFPHLFKNLDTKFIFEIRLDGTIASDLVGRLDYITNATMNTRFSLKDLSLKLVEQRHATDVIHPCSNLTVKTPHWHQRTFVTPFSAATTYTVNITRDFPLIRRAKRIFFGMTEVSTTTHSNAFFMHHDAITGIEYSFNGVSKKNLNSKALIYKHMNNYYKTQCGHHCLFNVGETAWGHFQWLFFDLVESTYQNVKKGNVKTMYSLVWSNFCIVI